ncbi:hypothetical protein GCM10012285_24560 [Streptomyces kronopolitis]|uniref:CBS domain-containing protein n=1 Tax=Streptomyces kronopolitis TaxID=1612435 RepID=A0ABQ2JCY8_9ACTN|nr:hypothetical protein GCM10012285_24560 [Streptomyces kronopolitis]
MYGCVMSARVRELVVQGRTRHLAEGDARADKELAATFASSSEAAIIGADDCADEIFATMACHKVRWQPVIDGHRLVGMVALADHRACSDCHQLVAARRADCRAPRARPRA